MKYRPISVSGPIKMEETSKKNNTMLKSLFKLQGYLIETLMVNQKRWLYDVANEKREFSRGLGLLWKMDDCQEFINL